MKKCILTTLLLLSAILQGCDKDNTDEKEPVENFTPAGLIRNITINNIAQSPSYISEVAFVARVHVPPGGGTVVSSGNSDNPDMRYMLRIPYNENGMELILPENPPQLLFCNITEDIPEGFSISDTDANTISFVEVGCCEEGSDHISGQLAYRKQMERVYYQLVYIYADRPVKITGTAKDWWRHPATYDLTLEKGWNSVVEKRDYSGSEQTLTVTNQLPEGMEWRYDMWLGD